MKSTARLIAAISLHLVLSLTAFATTGARDEVKGPTIVAVSASEADESKVTIMMGRRFTPSDFEPTSPSVAQLSHDVWQSDFAGTLDILGQKVSVGGLDVIVVGIRARVKDAPVDWTVWIAKKS